MVAKLSPFGWIFLASLSSEFARLFLLFVVYRESVGHDWLNSSANDREFGNVLGRLLYN